MLTELASININGKTVNTGLSIPPNVRGYTLPSLSDSNKAKIHNLYLEVSVVIIDEISMVSNIHLFHIYKRLCKIFGFPASQSSVDLSIIIGGNLLQLQPIKSLQTFGKYNSRFDDFFNLWSLK